MFKEIIIPTLVALGLLAVSPSSTNYTLKAFDFGNGGGETSGSAYKLNAIIGGQAGNQTSSSSYKLGPGLAPTINANTPPAPSLTNPSNYYERLKLTLATGNNPATTRYNIAISDDNFVTTYYIQPDNTVGPTLNMSNYQTYAAWGGSSGFYILGLQPDTTYQVKVRAYSGKFSESSYSAVASASTVQPSITFSVATSNSMTPPYSVVFQSLAPGNTVYSTNYDPILGLSTNALFGGYVYINGNHGGLRSNASGSMITSETTDLDSIASGYGAQVTQTSQSIGGPLAAVAPYDGIANNVGAITNNSKPILSTPGQVYGATATIGLKAKTDIKTPSSGDYQDALTFVASMVF
ncbi:hypothetical protein KBB76_01885 [Candidatus Saccharibacteria bacterium]|jgi:hypothetical protein|nr:hypothetical protein [Candidatus Saccharibacteria bacterium]HPW48038.1 hypothetical protein [Candidatus Saccharibacteria bacterium]